MLQPFQRQLCLPPVDPDSLGQDGSRQMASHSRESPRLSLCFSCLKHDEERRQSHGPHLSWEQHCQCPRKTGTVHHPLSGKRYPGANSYRQQRGNHTLAELRQRFPSLAVLGDSGQGAKPACDSSVQSTRQAALQTVTITPFCSPPLCPAIYPGILETFTSLPGFCEDPGLPAQRPWRKEEGDQQCEHPLSLPQGN